MIAVVKDSATQEQLDSFIAWIEGRGFKTNVSQGDNETIVGIIGDTTQIDPFLLESMDIVERVQRVSEPFKKANRKFHPEDTVVGCGHGVLLGGGHFQVIAGPCSVEGKNLFDIARAVKEAGATMLRGGAYKPRTSPYSYQGMGEKGLDLLMEASQALDMPVVTEVMDPRDVELFVNKGVDVMQIGARNAQNFSLLKEVGKTNVPVLLKRGMSETIDELLMGAEYIMSEGNPNVILCERGIRTFETRTRNTFDVNAIPVIHHLSH
ncbi:MAG: 3-deoxy-7-phosphoheptulonate synthase, partial [Coriobacteriales bacterium]|nr:3-deoxy-7-phosphoheptulonate synthase [Coriobacteriales bacterium]